MSAVIQCPSCQKEYRWKPELAGKKVKCKCGEEFGVPANEPAVEGNDLYDLVDEPKNASGSADLQPAAVASPVLLDDGKHFRCPYCSERIEANSTLCVFCGSPLQPVVQPNMIQATPPTALRTVKMRKTTDEEKAGTIKLILLSVVGVVIVVAAVVFGWKHFPSRAAAVDPNLKPEDAAMQEKIDNQGGMEAKKWLDANDVHSVMGLSKKQALFKVDQFYQMGAKNVMAFGSGISTTLAIELPDDQAKRKAIFDWVNKWDDENHFKNDKDEGQKWLEVQMHV